MQIKPLTNIPIPQIVECFTEAFADYAVKMPSSPQFWAKRWKWARIDYSLSFGVFDEEKLVAFIMNGVDQHEGMLTAFNTGTGVLPAYRGQQWVDKMYDCALPLFEKKGVQKLLLEVLQTNQRAIRVYERIGFKITRDLHCFKGTLKKATEKLSIKRIDSEFTLQKENLNHHFYSWDNRNEAIRTDPDAFQSFLVFGKDGENIGRFTIVPSTGYLVQYEAPNDHFEILLNGVALVNTEIKVNNVDSRRKELIDYFLEAGLQSTVQQYEMECMLKELNHSKKYSISFETKRK